MQTLTTTGSYDEALERLHRTGPEFDGWLSNHGPMAVEALARRGHESTVHRWIDAYGRRLDELPESRRPITDDDERGALGDPARLGDWIAFFVTRVDEEPWQDVLVTWWPVLLPGIAAGATHGVIRTGHAVQALRAAPTEPRMRELAHALGYWAARWQAVPAPPPRGSRTPADLVATVPRVPRQEAGIRDRLAQLPGTPGWFEHGAALRPPANHADAPGVLDEVVDAVVLAYPRVAVGNPTMLVHAATAPHAVSRTLPSLPEALWAPSLVAAWAATCAVLAAYLPEQPAQGSSARLDPAEAWEVAVQDGGEHVIKLADTALDVSARTGDDRAVAAITTAVDLDA